MPVKLPIDDIQSMLNRLEDKIDSRFDKIESKLEKLDDKVEIVSKNTDKNTVVLEEHQRRALAGEKHSNLLEEKISLQRKEFEDKHQALTALVQPMINFPSILIKVVKLIGAIAVTASALGGALWSFLRFALGVI